MKWNCGLCGFVKDEKDPEYGNVELCPVCKSNDWRDMDVEFLKRNISDDSDFIEAMKNLRLGDPIEFRLKMSQFRAQVEQRENVRQAQQKNRPTNTVSCPYCQSTNLSKISTGSRMFSTMMFGFGSKKLGKQWHCNNCKSDF